MYKNSVKKIINFSAENLHLYHYAGNNPIRYTDPDGKIIDIIWDVAFTAYDVVNAISKTAKGDNSGWIDVGVDALAILIPGVPAGLSKIDDAVKLAKTADKVSDTGKSFYRSMSKKEAEAVKKTGKLRGGNPGETFFTDSKFSSSSKAQKRLSLQNSPEVQMEFSIKNAPKIDRNGTKVKPLYNQPGGGKEFMTRDIVEVNVINVQPY